MGTTRKIKVGGGWGVIFGKMENAWVIIQGDNSAEHYVLLSDLILMNFFKSFMIMKLKICTSGKSVGKICLKAIRDTFFQYMVCSQRMNAVRHEGKEE